MSLVREDRDEHTSGVSVVTPVTLQSSYVWKGYPLKASKREASLEMSFPILREVRSQKDYLVDRSEVEA